MSSWKIFFFIRVCSRCIFETLRKSSLSLVLVNTSWLAPIGCWLCTLLLHHHQVRFNDKHLRVWYCQEFQLRAKFCGDALKTLQSCTGSRTPSLNMPCYFAFTASSTDNGILLALCSKFQFYLVLFLLTVGNVPESPCIAWSNTGLVRDRVQGVQNTCLLAKLLG